jgi:hypothetical protein
LDVEHVDDRRLCCGTPPGIPDAFPSVCLAYKYIVASSTRTSWCQHVM